MRSKGLSAVVLIAAMVILGSPMARGEVENYMLTIKKHQFVPGEIHIPAHKKVRLTVKNLDATPSEFESFDLNREKVVVGGGTITVFIGPLRPGTYEFFDDFNPNTAHGHIIAQ